LIVSDVASELTFAVLLVTTGTTVATVTAEAFCTPFVVTSAVIVPAASGPVVIETVSDVAVAAVTLPTALLLNVTVLFEAVVSKPKPLIVIVLALALSRKPAFAVTTGITVAICTVEPLPVPFVVTTAVRLPAALGFTENVTVSDVVVAEVTVPIAPSLNATVLCDATASKPKPAIVTVVALAARFAVLKVTAGATVATCTEAPLEVPFDVTTAVRLPAVEGWVENVTVSDVAVAEVTVPTAPLLNVTVLLLGVVSKPKPLIVSVSLSAARLAVLEVITGATFATWIAVPLDTPFTVTTAVKLPAEAGFVEKVTVSEVAVAEETVPTAPSLNVTKLLPAVVSKPTPMIVTVVALADNRNPLLFKTIGAIEATCTCEPLLIVFVATTTDKLPADTGFAENVTVSDV
jgi:hypothetical protein